MPLWSFEGKSPVVHPSAFIAATAVLVGDVTVEENASVWYNAVLRADFGPIVVRRGANVQDCAVVHVTPLHPVEIGAGATVGHSCVIHGATLAEEALLGLLMPLWQLVIGAVVLVVILVSVGRLARRGPSRMSTALLVTAAAIAGLAVLGVLFQR